MYFIQKGQSNFDRKKKSTTQFIQKGQTNFDRNKKSTTLFIQKGRTNFVRNEKVEHCSFKKKPRSERTT